MRRSGLGPLLIALFAGLFPAIGSAGTYFKVDRFTGRDPTMDPEYVPPFAIVHPVGYSGSGGTLEVKICVAPGDEILIPGVDAAIEHWNRLLRSVGNCVACGIWEDPPPPASEVNAMSVLLHEIGHCAMGLDHSNHHELTSDPTRWQTGECDVDSDSICGEGSSFTASINATEITSGAGTARGDGEDVHENQCPSTARGGKSSVPTGEILLGREWVCLLGGACATPPNCCPQCPGPNCPAVPMQVQNFSFFRRNDNNPVIVDGTVIDMTTFSRAPGNLPSGHTYAANANLEVAEALGFPSTQSVMYSSLVDGQKLLGLSADDVNMVEMAKSGANRIAGDSDDYTIVLLRISDCADADIEISFSDLLPQGTLGACVAARPQPSFAQSPPVFHWTMTKEAIFARIEIEINVSVAFEHSIPFRSGFETDDLSEWSVVVP